MLQWVQIASSPPYLHTSNGNKGLAFQQEIFYKRFLRNLRTSQKSQYLAIARKSDGPDQERRGGCGLCSRSPSGEWDTKKSKLLNWLELAWCYSLAWDRFDLASRVQVRVSSHGRLACSRWRTGSLPTTHTSARR